MNTIGTNTHYVTRPGYEGACCADCAAAVGQYRALLPSAQEFGEPCWSCEEMAREADADAIRAEEERNAIDDDIARREAMANDWAAARESR
jgi:hypothetical protein